MAILILRVNFTSCAKKEHRRFVMVEQPIFKSSDFIATAGIPKATAKRILPALREAGVLKTFVEARGQRSAVMSFPALLNIAEGRDVF